MPHPNSKQSFKPSRYSGKISNSEISQRKLQQNHRPSWDFRKKDWSNHLDLVHYLLGKNKLRPTLPAPQRNKLSLSSSPAFDPQSNSNPTADQTLVEHLPILVVVPSTRMTMSPKSSELSFNSPPTANSYQPDVSKHFL